MPIAVERVAQLRDGGGFRVIDQIVLVAGVLPVLKVRDEAGLRVVVMSAARGDLLARLCVVDWMPFGDDMEVGGDIEQAIEDQWPRLAGKLFQRENANVIVIHPQVAAMRLQLRAAYLPVEMTRAAQRRVVDFGGAEVYETPDKPEGLLPPLAARPL